MITYRDNSTIPYQDWVHLRINSIGASEIGAVVYGNKWTSNLEIFYEKIGRPRKDVNNIRAFLGKETEDVSAKCWSYYDGYNDNSVVENVRNGNKLKDCLNLNFTATNSLYPHLSCTPDREIQPFGVYDGRGKGSLEIKNTNTYVLNSYESGLPTDNVVQLIAQLMICEYDYGELFYFIDNARFKNYPHERKLSSNIEEIILAHTVPFWENILKARPLFNQLYEANRNHNMRLVNELQKEIARLEPPPQNTAGYEMFLTERYKDRLNGAGIIAGKDTDLIIARKHKELAKQLDEIEAQKRLCEIELKRIIGDNSGIDFGKNGKVTWFVDKQGKRKFINKTK